MTLGFEKLKARTRALVEHPFHIVKNLFRHRKVRCRGLKKSTAQFQVLSALANLVITQKTPAERGMIPPPLSPTKSSQKHTFGKHLSSVQGESRLNI
jgi:hypothetical protein